MKLYDKNNLVRRVVKQVARDKRNEQDTDNNSIFLDLIRKIELQIFFKTLCTHACSNENKFRYSPFAIFKISRSLKANLI